eukprot:scaffold209589_cov35-Tisochrysis_lutea.AAC.5
MLNLARARDGLAVGDLRRANVALNLELPLHAIADDVEVELAHALDNRLAGLLIARKAERGVFCGELDERVGHLLLVSLRLGLDGDLDHGLRELHLLKNDRCVGVAESLAGGRVLAADNGDDVAGACNLDVSAVIGVHLEHATHSFALTLDRVEDRGALLEDA